MTTLILAKKLSSVKLEKIAFEKIELQRVHNMQKKRKAVQSLKKILESQDFNKSCRLCLKMGYKNIFKDNQSIDLHKNIKYVFDIEVSEGDCKPQHICESCEHIVTKAAQLKQTAEITQWRLQQELELVSEPAESFIEESDDNHGGYLTVYCDKNICGEWTCKKCSGTFTKQEEYEDHVKLKACQSKLRYYVCESCGIKFKTMSRLKRHRLIHTGSLQHACAQCPYRGRTKYALAVHQRWHSGERPARCSVCAATFANSSNLASHMRRHSPPRYHCPVCRRPFKFNEAMQNHVATQHSLAKPHMCGLCGKAFATRKMICRHERRVHNRPRLRAGIVPNYVRQQEENT